MKRQRMQIDAAPKAISKKRRGKGMRETPINAVKYSGPISSPAIKQASDLHTFVLVNSGQLVSSGAGVLATVFDNTAQAAASPEWTGLSNLFKEWRILAMEIRFIPWNQYSKATTTTTTPVYIVLDRTTATPLASATDALKSSTCREKSLENSWTVSTRMNSIEEAVWTPSGSSLATDAKQFIKLYASGLSNTITYGDFITHCVVQFRSL